MSARHPKRTISFVMVVSVSLLVLGLVTNFHMEVDENKLWTPQGSRPIRHRDWIQQKSGFPLEPRDFILLFHANNGQDVALGRQTVDLVFTALDTVRALPRYASICSTGGEDDHTCEIGGLVRFWNYNATLFRSLNLTDEQVVATLSNRTYPDGTPLSENDIFGFPQRQTDTDQLVSVRSMTVVIQLPPTDAAKDLEADALQVIRDLANAWDHDPTIDVVLQVMAERSFADEFERAILADIPLIPIVFTIMSTFTALVFWRRGDAVQSRTRLGLSAVVGVTLSLMSGYGLLFCIGITFTSMTQILPFIIFGIGLDNTFVVMGAYGRTNPQQETTERIHQVMDEVGASITLTTLTTTSAFTLGCMSSISAVRWLCLYAFPTILFIYFYQLSFFIACMVLDERRVRDHRRDCCLIGVAGAPDVDNTTNKTVVAADVSMEVPCGVEQAPHDTTTSSSTNNENINSTTLEPKEATPTLVDRFMDWYAAELLKPWVKFVVMVVFMALAAACGYSASCLTQEFEFTEVMPSDSYVAAFFHAMEKYSARNAVAPYAYFRYVDQSDVQIQKQMHDYVTDLVQMESIEHPPDFFWLTSFQDFVQNNGDSLGGASFSEQLDVFLAVPKFQDLYWDDIVRDATNGAIVTSRVRLYMDNVSEEDVKNQIETLQDQRDVTAAQAINQGHSEWPFFTYDDLYNIWEFYTSSVEELILATILGVVSVTGVALIFVPHWTAALFVLPLIAILYVDMLGVMQWAGIHVNAVSYVTIVMSIGLLVDFIVHILLRYYESTASCRRDKTVQTLKSMGTSILIGGISTFFGTLPLAFSTSTVFRTIFIAFLGLATLGIGHGLILLPVLLATIGPEK